MTQQVIHHGDGQHCLDDGRGANSDAGIVAPLGYYLGCLTFDIHRPAGQTQTRRRFERDTPILEAMLAITNTIHQ